MEKLVILGLHSHLKDVITKALWAEVESLRKEENDPGPQEDIIASVKSLIKGITDIDDSEHDKNDDIIFVKLG